MVDPNPSLSSGRWYTPYTAVLASRIRAQRAYPLSFATDLLSALVTGLAEFAEVWVIFHNIKVLGGLTLTQTLVLFGLSNTAFAVADMLVGHLDTLPTYLRTGTLEIFHLRPQPLLAQLITSDISLRRIARVGVAATILIIGFALNPIVWNPTTVALLVITIPSATAIFAGLFVAAAGVQFFLINSSEAANSFTYGGSFASQQPASIFPTPLRLLFGIAIPVAFTAYLPTLELLGLPGPPWLSPSLAWASPLAVLWVWGVALWLWRQGARHYQGAGG